MNIHPWSKLLVIAAVFCGLAGCGGNNNTPAPAAQDYQKGWSHNCTLSCTNVSVNQSETVERPGRMGAVTACRENRQVCETGRDAACAGAVAMTNNETLYDNCQLLSVGECVEGCTFPQ